MPQENLEQQVGELEKRPADVERRSRGRIRFFEQFLLSPLLFPNTWSALLCMK